MIIYNVTVSVDADIADEWLDWMRTTHIPDVMATGLFLDHRLCRVLNVEDEGRTFAIQYTLADMATYDRYAAEHAHACRTKRASGTRDGSWRSERCWR